MPRFREELILEGGLGVCGGEGGAPGGEDVLAPLTLILARSAATLSPRPLTPSRSYSIPPSLLPSLLSVNNSFSFEQIRES